MESTIGCESGVVEGFFLGKFKMEQGLVIWKEFCMKSPIGGDRGVAGGGSLGKYPD